MASTDRPRLFRIAMVLIGLFCFCNHSAFAQAQQPASGQETKVEDSLAYCDLLFSQGKFNLAANQYLRFIRETPQSPNIQSAWYRLGECYLKVDQLKDAEDTFNYIINNFKTGPFVGHSAYTLAVNRFNQKDYRNALAYFQVAAKEMTQEDAKLRARFYYARCLQLTEQPKEAVAQYDLVIKAGSDPEKNPYYERCLLETARLLFDTGDIDKSLARFEKLAEETKNQEFKEEALVRGGLLASEAGKTEVSEKFLDQALRFSDTSPWKALAQVGAIFNAFTREDYDKVIGIYNAGAYSNAPEESRAKMLLVVGHSFRMKNDLDSALRVYSLVEAKYPNRQEGAESGYRKLQILHQQGDDTLAEAADEFITRQRDRDPTSNFIDMAHLMKAEWFFNRAETSQGGPGSEFATLNYKNAAQAYAAVRDAKVDEKFHETRLYKQGWAQVEAGMYKEGIQTLSRFINSYPRGELASSALGKRAVAHQQMNDHALALEDFKAIVKGYPEAPELEFAMQQVGLLQAHLRRIPEMVASFESLLEKFPETKAAPEAHYWIGVGLFDQEQFEPSIPRFEKAREMNKEAYDDKATLRLVLAHYQLEKISKLATEARHYIEAAPPEEVENQKAVKRTTIPPQIMEFLGRKLAADEEYKDAEFFLSEISTPDEPEKTPGSLWRLLAECRVQLRQHVKAITAFDHFLIQTERPSERASAYLMRGKAQLCLKEFEAARESARESLRSQKEGRTNAEARILMGDVSAKEGNLEEAAREYLVVSQIFMDREVTPYALVKAINAYQSLGNTEQVENLERQLRRDFPNWVAPEETDDGC